MRSSSLGAQVPTFLPLEEHQVEEGVFIWNLAGY